MKKLLLRSCRCLVDWVLQLRPGHDLSAPGLIRAPRAPRRALMVLADRQGQPGLHVYLLPPGEPEDGQLKEQILERLRDRKRDRKAA